MIPENTHAHKSSNKAEKDCHIKVVNEGVHGRGIGRGVGRVRKEYKSETKVDLNLTELGRWIEKDLHLIQEDIRDGQEVTLLRTRISVTITIPEEANTNQEVEAEGHLIKIKTLESIGGTERNLRRIVQERMF